MNENLKQLETHILGLSKKEFHQYAATFLIAITIVATTATYYIYSVASSKMNLLENTRKFSNQAALIIDQHNQLEQEDAKIKKLLEKNKDFNLSMFFENLSNKHSMKPEPNWKPETEQLEGSEEFEEITLQASFKKQTTEKLVAFLNDIYEEAMVYLKELTISKNKDKPQISYEITLATKRYKPTLKE
jgi:hypothetical protein